MQSKRIAIPLIVSLLAGCAVGPDYKPVEVDTGAGWTQPEAAGSVTDADLAQWWRRFDDPTLDRLVETALIQNLDIREAAARVAEVRALRDAAAGGHWPVANVNGSVSRRRLSENGPFPVGQIPGYPRNQTVYDVGFDASWELDVFGGTRRAVEAAGARLDAATEQVRAARLSVAAETARVYLALRGAQHERQALNAAVAASRSSTDLVRRQFDAGEVPEASLAQAEAALASVETQLPAIEAQVRTAALSLGILLGELPESEVGLADTTADFVTLAPLPVGERADILRRRPDVRAAERRVAAATADVGVATAELFPKIGITANGGFESLHTGNFFDSGSQNFSITPLISWRIFDGGRVRAQIHASEAREQRAALLYEKTVKTALTDAERALTRYSLGLSALQHQETAIAAARRNYGFATARYKAGEISLLELLDAEQGLRAAENAYAQTHTRAATDLVALFKALGGGWGSQEQAASENPAASAGSAGG
ncbi:MAG: efflux transporter outer membrane subunit [Lysobacterales bacterium]|jgi:NodT family efflux transporter outer membrane factor (OMF) lipoprotein